LLPKDVRESILKERVKSAEDRRLIHEKKLNNLRYRSDNDDTKNLHYRLDVGSQYPQKAVCMNAFRNALAIYRRPWEKLNGVTAWGTSQELMQKAILDQ